MLTTFIINNSLNNTAQRLPRSTRRPRGESALKSTPKRRIAWRNRSSSSPSRAELATALSGQPSLKMHSGWERDVALRRDLNAIGIARVGKERRHHTGTDY
ncbi:hypothetical protein Taro_048065 [Colocasia esculenta]|uniref:Uncharacterized protein n=1 Tax=Colocasia esculenta TaxID=4460 RepID=A0A843X262_COLES|nr:hypothetical protein [Colocasia esculenta]